MMFFSYPFYRKVLQQIVVEDHAEKPNLLFPMAAQPPGRIPAAVTSIAIPASWATAVATAGVQVLTNWVEGHFAFVLNPFFGGSPNSDRESPGGGVARKPRKPAPRSSQKLKEAKRVALETEEAWESGAGFRAMRAGARGPMKGARKAAWNSTDLGITKVRGMWKKRWWLKGVPASLLFVFCV